MLNNLQTNKLLWKIIFILTLIVSLSGVFSPGIYNNVFAPEFIPGAFPQDVLTALLSLYLLYIIPGVREGDFKKQIFIVGVVGSLFYLYGIFTIERVYNYLYIIYLSIFALSFWSILYSLINLKRGFAEKVKLSDFSKKVSSYFAIGIGILFSFLWVMALIPLMKAQNRIDYLYSIYIIDLAFIMPAFFITAFLTLKNKGVGILLLPAVFIVGFFVIFPLGLGEVAKLFYGQQPNISAMLMSFVFSVMMLLNSYYHIKNIKIK